MALKRGHAGPYEEVMRNEAKGDATRICEVVGNARGVRFSSGRIHRGKMTDVER